ncbi:MAG: ABC transporter permease [Oscillospiraceae bacterium]|nr:ABC transporter permease [Oscillospiraceae bacterium]
MKKLLRRNEFYVSIVIVLLVILIQTKSGQFFTANNLVDLARSCILPGILTLGITIEIIAHSIDVSFPSIAMITMYTVTSFATNSDYDGSVWFLFIIAALMGTALGAINGILAAWLKLPTLIITLATSSIYMGVMQGVLKCRVIAVMAEPLEKLSQTYLFIAKNKESGLTSPLPILFLLFVAVVAVVGFMMKYTMLGRSIYAFGGDPVSAERAGFNTVFIQIFVFAFMGCLAGLGGMTRTVLTGSCQPTTLEGYEMTCIAAAVLGGTRLSGGVGTVKGSLLGVLLMMIVSNNLILLGIPTYWSKFVTGIFIILGIGISSYQALRSQREISASILEDAPAVSEEKEVVTE